MFDRILLAVDGTEADERAMTCTTELARRLGSEVVVVHVRETDMAFGVEAFRHEPTVLDAAVSELARGGLAVRGVLVDAPRSDIGDEIMRTAKAERVDMIVIGTRGLGELGAVLSGSVARHLLHDARVPVLVVHT